MNQDKYDAAKGCLLGALCGDAAGATLEFLTSEPSPEQTKWAMGMPGGGKLNVAPGQITDDGELTLCMARALAESETFDLEKIARSYAEWIESHPFDIGITTISSLGAFRGLPADKSYAQAMTNAAYVNCMRSKANGSLMRNTPLGIWGHNLAIADLADYARQDNALSHPNPSCGLAVACYTIAIATLIEQPGERELAFNQAKTWLESQEEIAKEQKEYTSWQEVRSWLADAENLVSVPFTPHIGFIQIAFTHAFLHLLIGSNYQEAIAETLLGGGDTDTNACIVGGLIGAAEGVNAIPQIMRDRVLNCDTSLGKHLRPSFLHPRQVDELISKLMN